MNRSITAALAVAGLLAFPAASQAADNFGSQLKHEPANGRMECDPLGPCTFVGYKHPTPPERRHRPLACAVRRRRDEGPRSLVSRPTPCTFAFSNITRAGHRQRHAPASASLGGTSARP